MMGYWEEDGNLGSGKDGEGLAFEQIIQRQRYVREFCDTTLIPVAPWGWRSIPTLQAHPAFKGRRIVTGCKGDNYGKLCSSLDDHDPLDRDGWIRMAYCIEQHSRKTGQTLYVMAMEQALHKVWTGEVAFVSSDLAARASLLPAWVTLIVYPGALDFGLGLSERDITQRLIRAKACWTGWQAGHPNVRFCQIGPENNPASPALEYRYRFSQALAQIAQNRTVGSIYIGEEFHDTATGSKLIRNAPSGDNDITYVYTNHRLHTLKALAREAGATIAEPDAGAVTADTVAAACAEFAGAGASDCKYAARCMFHEQGLPG